MGARRVLDLGAGTGQLTRQLVDRGLDVVAVEPSAGMRREFNRVLPGVETLAGAAEDIPLGRSAVDAVLVAQAWHWVDTEQAVPEIARVLSPGGQLGLLWNIRDERTDWVAELGRLLHREVEQSMNSHKPQVGHPFGPVERFDVEWVHRTTPDQLLDLVASRSYVITLPAEERAQLVASVAHLLDSHPTLAGTLDIAMPYVTRCSRTQLDENPATRPVLG